MSTKFYCNSPLCMHAEKGPFILELCHEAVMDGNNLATVFCHRCGNPLKQLPSDTQKGNRFHRFYCHSSECSGNENGLFFIDLPGEAIMDQNNIATVFCPKCGKEMRSFGQESCVAINF